MKQRDIIFLLASSFFIVFIWIIFEIYHNSITSTVPERLTVQIVPIKPDFDSKTIADIKTRDKIKPIYEAYQISPTPTPSEAQQITPTPEITENQTASEGAIRQ